MHNSSSDSHRDNLVQSPNSSNDPRREYTRREALGTLGASILTAGVFNSSLAGSIFADEKEKKVSQPRFSVRVPLVGKDLRERVELLAAMNCQGIEIGDKDVYEKPAAETLKHFAGTSLKISAVGGIHEMVVPSAEKRKAAVKENIARLPKARDLGATALVIVPIFGAKRPYDSSAEDKHALEDRLLIEGLTEIAPTAEKTGVKVILEPLTKLETYYMNLQSHCLKVVEKVGSPAIGILSDFYHMQMEEKDIPAALKECCHRTYYIHAADGKQRTEPGSLPFDYRPGFKVLKASGYHGWITVEAKASGPNVNELVKKSLEYLRRQWSEA